MIIQPGNGISDDGWWKCEDLVQQMREKAIPAFKFLHPGKLGLFIFDNSLNHKKAAKDGLSVDSIPGKDGGKNASLNKRDGYYTNSTGDVICQKMTSESGVAKGIRTILLERGIDNTGLRIRCSKPNMCKNEAPFNCCCANILAHQQDFLNQKGMLEECVTLEYQQLFLLLPKFHCEFNPIENYWGEAKRYARSNCDYTFKGLQEVVPKALDSVVNL